MIYFNCHKISNTTTYQEKDVSIMYYEINVSLNGKHFFATAERSITNEQKLKEVYSALKEKFPYEDGYDMTVTRYETTGKHIDMNNVTRTLTKQQIHTKLNNYYKENYGELDTDEWYVNPSDNVWKFIRDGKHIILACDVVYLYT